MKKIKLSASILAFAIVFIAFKKVNDIIERLGMEHKSVQSNIMSNLVGNFSFGPMEDNDYAGNRSGDQESDFRLPYIPAPKLATILTGDKVGAAKELCEYIKKYFNSTEFMEDYNNHRERAMPRINYGPSMSSLKDEIRVYKLNINNYKNDTKYVAEQQAKLDEAQKKLAAVQEAAKKPFPGKANWEKKYPIDPSIIVKKRLQEYLQLAASVDFNAALTAPDKYKIKKFVNPVYEKKNNKWKAIYRAGKEVNDVVTTFIKEWLKGEIIAKEKTSMAGIKKTEPVAEPSVTTAKASTTNEQASNSETTSQATSPAPASTDKKTPGNKLKEKLKTIIRN